MRLFVCLAAAFIAGEASVRGQVLQAPERSQEGQFNRRLTQSSRPETTLVVDVNLLGGFDDNAGPASALPSVGSFNGYFGTASADAHLSRGTNRRAMGFGARGYLSEYEGGFSQQGGAVAVDGLTMFGRRTMWSGTASLANEPAFLATGVTPISRAAAGITDSTRIDPGSTSGVTSQRNRLLNGATTMRHAWSARQSSTVTATASDSHPTGEIGFQNQQYDVGAAHAWTLTRFLSMTGGYRYNDMRAADVGGTVNDQRLTSHTGTGGLLLNRRLSPRRTLSFEATGGASRVTALSTLTGLPVDLTAPFASGAVRMDVGRSWALSSDVRHEVSLLVGISPQPFSNDTLQVSFGGAPTGRLEMAMSASYAQGRARDGEASSFSNLSGTIQSQVRLGSRWTVLANYTYYKHDLQQVLGLPEGFPTRFDLHSARVGVTLRFPIIQPRQRRG